MLQTRRSLVSTGAVIGAGLVAVPASAQAAKPPPRLSVFVLDTHRGRPATGLKVDFSVKDGGVYKPVKTVMINATGNTDEPVFKAAEMVVGDYEFNLHVSEHDESRGVKLPTRPFLSEVPIPLFPVRRGPGVSCPRASDALELHYLPRKLRKETMMSDDNNLERRAFLAGAVATAGLFVATNEAEAQEKRPGGLSTHVLDTYSGIPASGMKIDFLTADGDGYKLDKSIETNEFGRTDHPIMPVVDLPGKFQLVFYVADYFKAKGLDLPDPNFL